MINAMRRTAAYRRAWPASYAPTARLLEAVRNARMVPATMSSAATRVFRPPPWRPPSSFPATRTLYYTHFLLFSRLLVPRSRALRELVQLRDGIMTFIVNKTLEYCKNDCDECDPAECASFDKFTRRGHHLSSTDSHTLKLEEGQMCTRGYMDTVPSLAERYTARNNLSRRFA